MVRIKSITLQNLFAFGRTTKFRLLDTNYIVGPNNSGKTNLLRVLRLLEKTLTHGERLQLSQRHVKMEVDSVLELDLNFAPEEADLILRFLTFPLDEAESKIDIGGHSDLSRDFENARLTILWKYDGSSSGTIPKGYIFFTDSGVRVDVRSAGLVVLDTEKARASNAQMFNSSLRSIISFGEDRGYSDTKSLFEGGFQVEDVSPPKYRIVHAPRIKDSSDYANFGAEHALFASEVRKQVGGNRYSTDTSFEDVIASFFRKRMLFTSELRHIQEMKLGDDAVLKADGTNLANFLLHLSTNKDVVLQKVFHRIADDFKQVFDSNKISLRAVLDQTEKYTGNKTELIQTPRLYIYDEILEDQLPLENVGSGIFEATYLLTRSLTESNGLILLDEPALHLHPVQITVFKKFLLRNAKKSNNQLIIITHSPVFIGKDIIDPNTQISYFRRRDGFTECTQIDDGDRTWIQTNLQKLRFEFNPSLFFARSVILVEGDSDVGFLEGCADRFGLDFERSDVLILPVGGKTNFFKIMKLLDMFSISYVVMADKDSLMEIFSDSVSPLLHALHELNPHDEDLTNKLKNAQENVVEEIREPWWLGEVKKVFLSSATVGPGVENAIQSLTKKHDHSIKVYQDRLFQDLSSFVASRGQFIIEQGDIEDLLKTTDQDLYDSLAKEFGKRNTRLFVREFVEKLDSSKLPLIQIGQSVLTEALSAAK